MNPMLGQKTLKRILGFQKNEITEYHIYSRLSQKIKGANNKKILQQIATDELRHYNFYKIEKQNMIIIEFIILFLCLVFFTCKIIKTIRFHLFALHMLPRSSGAANKRLIPFS